MDPISRLVATGAAGAGEPPSEYWITRNTISGSNYYILGTATDSSNNVYCWGYRSGTPAQGVLIKKDIYGVTQWAKAIDPGTGNDIYAEALAFDGTYLYCIGNHYVYSTTEYNIFVAKFDTSGNLIWQRTYAESPNGMVGAITFSGTVDSSGNPIVGFRYYNGSVYHAGVMKLNSSGVIQWTKGLFTSGNTYNKANPGAYGVATDSNNDVIVGGSGQNGSSNFARTAFIAKLAGSNGSTSWSNQYFASVDIHSITDVAVDSNNNIYGLFQWNYTSGPMDLMKWNSSGSLLSSVGIDNYMNDSLYIDPNDYIYVSESGIINKFDTSLSSVYARILSGGHLKFPSVASASSTAIVAGGNPNNNLNRLPIDGSKTGTYTLGNYSVYTPSPGAGRGSYPTIAGMGSTSPTMTTTTPTFTVSSATVVTTTEYIY